MADLLIKGMGYPKRCEDCPCSEGERDLVWCKLILVPNECVVGGLMWKELKPHELNGRPNWCPLVEVELQGYDNYWESEIWTEVK